LEFAGETFMTRSVLSSTSAFRDCTFRGCRATTSGNYVGRALCLSTPGLSLLVADCAFADCYASDAGAALYVDDALSLSVTGTSCTNCSAMLEPFLCASLNSSGTGSLTLLESSATMCSATYNTMYLGFKTFASGNTTKVESLNLTANRASMRASGMLLLGHFALSLDFCVIQRNTPASVLFFYRDILTSRISCLALLSNNCDAVTSQAGVIYVSCDIVLRS
jgi:hypothetical protein